MTSHDPTPARLAVRLILYFVVFFGSLVMIVTIWPDAVQSLPIGGHDALDRFGLPGELLETPRSTSDDEADFEITTTFRPKKENVSSVVWFLCLHLSGTILLMIPITWTYMATRQDIGYRKNFARALMVLPICATTIVLLIQDSLALAFGLAAMVAAVRFRVALDETIDGVFVFAAICVGLAAGIGYLGVASVMATFFCFANVSLWYLEFGENPIDNARQERKRARLTGTDDKYPA
jgi:hypothetical protein